MKVDLVLLGYFLTQKHFSYKITYFDFTKKSEVIEIGHSHSTQIILADRPTIKLPVCALIAMMFCGILGVGGILVMGLGIIISGVFILRVKPNARFVAAWIAFTAVIYALGKITQLLSDTIYSPS